MKKFRFLENNLAGDVYYPNPETGVNPTSAGMFLYGFPDFVGPGPVTEHIVSNGLVSFQPHYFGTYDSAKLLSPESMIETCKAAQSIFDRGYVVLAKDGSKFKLPKLEFCIGHSFGALIALRAAPYMPDLKVLLLMGPALHYGTDPSFGLHEDGMSQLNYIRESHPKTYNLAPPNEWETILTGRDPLPSLPPHPNLREIMIVVGEKDKYFDIQALRNNGPSIVRAYCGENAEITFIVIPGSGHPTVEMLANPNSFSLSKVFSKHKLK